MYYNYHAHAKSLILNGHCVRAIIKQNYNKICPALLLVFNNHRPMPIRLYHFEEYFILLKNVGIKIETDD